MIMDRKKEKHKSHDPKLEKQIEDEIYRRVKEREKAYKERQFEDIEEKAAVEAIEEITELPDEEVERIAREVRSDFNTEENKHLKNRINIFRFGSAAIGAIIIVCLCIWYYNYHVEADEEGSSDIPKITYGSKNEISYRVVFTTEVDENYHPVDAINKVSLDIDMIYLYITWQNLPVGNHKYRIRVVDGVGSLVWDYFWEYNNKNLIDNTWLTYKPKKAVDKPGRWQFEIYLDGIKMFEKFLQVESS